jgi:peptidoglycan-N-acetylglucosamine deacetylase
MRILAVMLLLPGLVLAPALDAAAGARPLRSGDRGDEVAALQRMLRAASFDPGPADGIFGPSTRRAVLALQERSGLKADGIAGPETLRALGAGTEDHQLVRHRVGEGETLSAIALRFGTTAAELVRINGLKSPHLIRAGAELLVPRGPEEARARLVLYTPEAQTASPAPARAAGSAASPVPLALTFNSDLDPIATPAALELLGRLGMKATFFVGAEAAERNPGLLARIVADGHEVGSMGVAGREAVSLSAAVLRRDLRRTAGAIAAASSTEPLWYRPPFGRWNQRMERVAAESGMRMVLWTNVAARDSLSVSPAVLAERMRESLFPGAILMLHEARPNVTAALPVILQAVQESGYASVTLSDLVRGR